MNFNDYPEELKKEEQTALECLISKIDSALGELDQYMEKYVYEARNINVTMDPDLYLSKLLAERGKKNTEKERKEFLQTRDELYKTRLLLVCEDDYSTEIKEIKVGLHSCIHNAEEYVISWKQPLCRHYILDDPSREYESVVDGKFGKKYHTHYTLLVKNNVKLRFTHVVSAMNMFPGIFDDEALKKLKQKGFFSDEFLDDMIKRFNPDEYNPDSAAQIISDEFLQELLERRSTPEFKNIVFSIQKKQGEIIQAPYQRNMLVQGCAGSGKSMIMLHRLPILLYDNPDIINRNNLYVVTPSQMYIQLAENMRHQLEISDINMGTIEQYYDYCISRYPGHAPKEYGETRWGNKLDDKDEKYVYSVECVKDIKEYLGSIHWDDNIDLERAQFLLGIKSADKIREGKTYEKQINRQLLKIQNVLNANDEALKNYVKLMSNALHAIYSISSELEEHKFRVLQELAKLVSKEKREINKANISLKNLNPEKNIRAIKSRNAIIELCQKNIQTLKLKMKAVETDSEYFAALLKLNEKIKKIVAPFEKLGKEFNEDNINIVYGAIAQTGELINNYSMLSRMLLEIGAKYVAYVDISKNIQKADQKISALQAYADKYIDYDWYCKIIEQRDVLSDFAANAVMNAYEMIMGKIGIKRKKNGKLGAVKCSPYIYLQILYQYKGVPSAGGESLLAIDEAQGIAPEELRLLKNVNGGNVIFNLYGDIYQHIEGTKGINNWNELNEILDLDIYKIQENYRNALQITEYCNRKFEMEMIAINTPGSGVHEIVSDVEFEKEMTAQLLGNQRAGLAAILVSNNAEARYLMHRFSDYEQKFHDMTNEEFSVHHTRWNIIKIDDAKGLEFTTVIVLSGRMSHNQRYIAYTRALDNLYVYENVLNTTGFEDEIKNKDDSETAIASDAAESSDITINQNNKEIKTKHTNEKVKRCHHDSEVRDFFISRGLEVVDKRDEGGRLWVIGEKSVIRDEIDAAIAKFKISGKYAASKESDNKSGWYTKTDK